MYEVPIRESKEHLRNEIERLRQRQRSTEQLLAGLIRPDLRAELLARLDGEQPVEGIYNWLENAIRQRDGAFPLIASADDVQFPVESSSNAVIASTFASNVPKTPADPG